jgi:hypothetical protein
MTINKKKRNHREENRRARNKALKAPWLIHTLGLGWFLVWASSAPDWPMWFIRIFTESNSLPEVIGHAFLLAMTFWLGLLMPWWLIMRQVYRHWRISGLIGFTVIMYLASLWWAMAISQANLIMLPLFIAWFYACGYIYKRFFYQVHVDQH